MNQAFEKLLALRADVENALEKSAAKTSDRLGVDPRKGSSPESRKITDSEPAPLSALPKSNGPEALQKNEAAQKSQPPQALDFEACMEKIWEQLIATPPLHGRSMSTVKLGDTRILLSSWEVAAFVSETGVAAEDLRRAVAARAMVSTATTNAKEKGHTFALDKALAVGRVEASRLQDRVDAAKQAKDTEAAVNLGISAKRLLSALDEAEKL